MLYLSHLICITLWLAICCMLWQILQVLFHCESDPFGFALKKQIMDLQEKSIMSFQWCFQKIWHLVPPCDCREQGQGMVLQQNFSFKQLKLTYWHYFGTAIIKRDKVVQHIMENGCFLFPPCSSVHFFPLFSKRTSRKKELSDIFSRGAAKRSFSNRWHRQL